MTMTKTNQNIVPHLWYDKEANEAAEFYASIFPDSRITNVTTLKETPSGELSKEFYRGFSSKKT